MPAPLPHEVPEYLNLDGYRPIVKPGNTVTLTMWIRRETFARSDINSNWMIQYIRNVLNIDLRIEETYADTYTERRNLALAANDLPDIMINQGIGVNEFVRFGMGEGMFLALSDYISPELTPNMHAILESYPDVRNFNTTPDGKMYSFSNLRDDTRYPLGEGRVFINTRWMDLAGITEAPGTVDDFIDMLRKFKELTPEQVGARSRITPMISANEHDRRYFINALGFIGGDVWGILPTIDVRNRRIAIPAGEPEWEEFIRIYHTMYQEGLIHPDYFTMAANRAEARAQFAEGNAGVCADAAPYVSMPDSFDEWISVVPLTSSVNPVAAVTYMPDVSIGTFIVSSATRHPHAVMRLLDWLYSSEMGYMSLHGPIAGSPDSFGFGGFHINETGDSYYYPDVREQIFESVSDYRANAVALSQETPRNMRGSHINMMKALGAENPQLREFDLSDGDDHYYVIVYNAHNGHFFRSLPPAFLTEAQIRRSANLRSVIENHVRSETARFIAGRRPLSEIPAYFRELQSMGIDEYREIFVNAYQNYIDNRTDWSTFRIDYD